MKQCQVPFCNNIVTSLPRNRVYCEEHTGYRKREIIYPKRQKHYRVIYDSHPLSLEGQHYSIESIITMAKAGTFYPNTMFARNGKVYILQDSDLKEIQSQKAVNVVSKFTVRQQEEEQISKGRFTNVI